MTHSDQMRQPVVGTADTVTETISAARVVTPTQILQPGWLSVTGGRIDQVGAGESPSTPTRRFPEGTLVPGFVDAHVHGGAGASYTDGNSDAVAKIAASHRRHGTTTTMASLVTAEFGELERTVTALADVVDDGLVAGIHLEGPWLNPQFRGAHEERLLRPPRPADVDRLFLASRGTIRMVTLAPELEYGLDAVRRIVGHGAVSAIGHTAAGYDQTRAALAAGASVGTHLFNAMSPLHHRDPGPVPALLQDDQAFVELIADGIHLHPAMLRHSITAAGPERCVLVTDAMAAAAADDGDYRLGGLDVHVRDGQARLAETGTIAGSTLTMDAALRHVVQVAGIPLLEAARAAATTPARLLGLDKVGALLPGYRADLVTLDNALHVTNVMRNGTWLDLS